MFLLYIRLTLLQLADEAHRQKIHSMHKEEHEDNGDRALDEESSYEDIRDFTRHRLDLIRQIIRVRRRSQWRAGDGQSYTFNNIDENERLRSFLSLERKKFRFENWAIRQQMEPQLRFLQDCCMHTNSLRTRCVYKDKEFHPSCLEDEAADVMDEEKFISRKQKRVRVI
jgi:hypothetical protein